MEPPEANKSSTTDEPENKEKANWMQVREAVAARSRASCHVSLHLRVDYKYNYKKIKEKNNINFILIIINISRRSSLEEVNHVKSIGQSMGLMGAWVISMGPQIQGPSPRTHSVV
jgi:hypothetical protein